MNILRVYLQSIHCRFDFIEKQTLYFSYRFTRFNSFVIVKNLDFVHRFNDIVSMNHRNIYNCYKCNCFDDLQKNVDEIEIFENIFVKINRRFDRSANFDVDMNLIFQQQIFIVWNHSNIVLWNIRNTFSKKTTHL